MSEQVQLEKDVPIRNSGIEWLGDIPANWDVMAVKRKFKIFNGSTPKSSEPSYWDGNIPWATPDDLGNLIGDTLHITRRLITEDGFKSCGTSMVPAGSIVISTRAPIGHIAIAGVPLSTNQGCRSLVFQKDGDTRFHYYLLHAGLQELQSWGAGSTFKEISKDKLGCIFICSPPIPEQQRIATFLDRETAKIDSLIAHKERLIELLQEKRTALITKAVTKGLNPDVPMKESGLDSLGNIPAHWDLKRLWHITPDSRPIMYGIVLPGPDVDDGVPIIKGGDVRPDRLCLPLLNKTTYEIDAAHERSRLVVGDLVYAIRGSIGDVELVPAELNGANITQDTARISYSSETDGLWLLYTMKSSAIFQQLEAGTMGATIKEINIRDLKRAIIPVPPKNEQEQISLFLKTEVEKIEFLERKIRDTIKFMQEYRTALISAAVTGKIDVREYSD